MYSLTGCTDKVEMMVVNFRNKSYNSNFIRGQRREGEGPVRYGTSAEVFQNRKMKNRRTGRRIKVISDESVIYGNIGLITSLEKGICEVFMEVLWKKAETTFSKSTDQRQVVARTIA
jgi:hypothetical protein